MLIQFSKNLMSFHFLKIDNKIYSFFDGQIVEEDKKEEDKKFKN